MNKQFVIYTVVVGGYDDINQPLVVDDRFDYVLFSDNLSTGTNVGIWQVRSFDYDDNDNFRRSRYPKILPTKVLPEYEASLYIDGNLQIATQYVYDRVVELYNENVEWGGICHLDLNCAYNEIISITKFGWVHDYDSISCYRKLKKEGFPEHYGLYENNCIYRRHNTCVDEAGLLWWNTLIDGFRRDQFSLMFCIWRSRPVCRAFLPEGELPRVNSSHFNYYKHNHHTKVVKMGLNEKIRRRVFRLADKNNKTGKSIYNRISISKYPWQMLYYYEFLYTLKYGVAVLLEMLKVRFPISV